MTSGAALSAMTATAPRAGGGLAFGVPMTLG